MIIFEDIYLSEDNESIYFGNSKIELRISKRSGTLTRLTDKVNDLIVVKNDTLDPSTCIKIGGKRKRIDGYPYSWVYGAKTLGVKAEYRSKTCEVTKDEVKFTFSLEVDDWLLEPSYIIKPKDSIFERSLRVTYLGSGVIFLRGVEFIIPSIKIGEISEVFLEAPGNLIKPHWPLCDVPQGRWNEMYTHSTYGVKWGMNELSPIRWSVGDKTPGIIAVQNPKKPYCILLHALNNTEPSFMFFERKNDKVSLVQELLVADRFEKGHALDCGLQYVLATQESWRKALETFNERCGSINLEAPPDVPEWARRAAFYEVYMGKDYKIPNRFESVEDLIKNMPYIKDLGFNCLQVMPTKYEIYDYYDVEKLYGVSENDLRKLISSAHEAGLKVILDFVIHGVVEDSPLLKEHPEWFSRTETGDYAMTYTYAFDYANEMWQNYVIEVMKFYVGEMGADGFRVDAPTWNFFPNWDRNIPYRPSYTYFGAARLMRKARGEIKKLNSEAIIYSERYGPTFASLCDVVYNYDELWIFPSIISPSPALARKCVWYAFGFDNFDKWRITCKDLCHWFQDRKLALPRNTIKAHHIDSHDTLMSGYEEPEWTPKYAREFFGLEPWKAFFALCALTDGALMNYAGGENGDIDFCKKILAIRNGVPEIKYGKYDYMAIKCTDDMIFTALSSFEENYALLIISFNSKKSSFEISLPIDEIAINPEARYIVYDILNDDIIKKEERLYLLGKELSKLRLELMPYGVMVLLVRKLLG